MKCLASTHHFRAAKVTQLRFNNLISNTFFDEKYIFCLLCAIYQNNWKWWIFTSPLCGQANIHHYSGLSDWNNKVRTVNCYWDFLFNFNMGIPKEFLDTRFHHHCRLKAHSVISYQTTSRKSHSPRGEGEGIKLFERLRHVTFQKILDKVLLFLYVKLTMFL